MPKIAFHLCQYFRKINDILLIYINLYFNITNKMLIYLLFNKFILFSNSCHITIFFRSFTINFTSE